MNRETVDCPVCGVRTGQPCDFFGEVPWITVDEDGEARRSVHAGRYVLTIPEDGRGSFWESAIDAYVSNELAALQANPAPPAPPHDPHRRAPVPS